MTSAWGFVIITVILMGGAAFSMGRNLAMRWRPMWHCAVYGVLLGCADRFLAFALSDGELLSVAGFLLDTAVIEVIGLTAYRLSQAHMMVAQYPWLYERSGLFGWREKAAEQPP